MARGVRWWLFQGGDYFKFCQSWVAIIRGRRLIKRWLLLAVYKSGTGTRGQGHRDACVGTWDVGTWDEGLEDINYGTRGRVGRGRGDVKYRDPGEVGCEWLLQKSQINAISVTFLVNMFWWKETHPALLRVPPCLFTKRRLGEDPLHWRKWNRCPSLLADGILEPVG